MRRLADENCDVLLIAKLRADGHDVCRVTKSARGADDLEVFGKAIQDDRVLLTHDLDFALISNVSLQRPPAIVLMRLAPLRTSVRADIVARFLRTVGEAIVEICILEPGSVRVRSLHSRE